MKEELHQAIVSGDAAATGPLVEKALAEGVKPLEVVQGILSPAMDEVGRRFESGDCFVPELLLAARAMKSAMAIIQPLLAESGVEPLGRVVVATVNGDLHDIGKNLVAALLEGAGFEVIDLGVDVLPGKIVEAVKEKEAQVVALSALLTTTMPSMRTTIEALEEAGVREGVKVFVGGAPITQRFAEEIGADGFSENAVGAVALARGAVAASS
ncbi:MAG: corrinoid protein [Verrucomicrobiales bacterium]